MAVTPQIEDQEDIKKQVEHVSHNTALQQIFQVDPFQAIEFRIQRILLPLKVLKVNPEIVITPSGQEMSPTQITQDTLKLDKADSKTAAAQVVILIVKDAEDKICLLLYKR